MNLACKRRGTAKSLANLLTNVNFPAKFSFLTQEAHCYDGASTDISMPLICMMHTKLMELYCALQRVHFARC